MTQKTPDDQKLEVLAFIDLLIGRPPGTSCIVSDVCEYNARTQQMQVVLPTLQLHCDSEACQGERFFSAISSHEPLRPSGDYANLFANYRCNNCGKTLKIYALIVHRYTGSTEHDKSGLVVKIGEWPTYGPPTPAKLISLVGPEREAFLQGRRCEILGLGIGAFAYYRRIIETQHSRLIEEIKKVATKQRCDENMIDQLDKAAKETQFTRSVDMVKGAIPASLLINGQNPLLLIHDALSNGLHAQSDADCLQSANAIRLVLLALAERISIVLRDERELDEAVSHLLKTRSERSAKK